MSIVREALFRFVRDTVMRKRIYAVTLSCAVIFAVVLIKGAADGSGIIADKNGKVIGIYRNDLTKISEYAFNLRISADGSVEEKEIAISTKPHDVKADKKKVKEDKKIDRENARDSEIDAMISMIEMSRSKRIPLPSKLSDGSKLEWEERKRINAELFVIPILYLIIICLMLSDGIVLRKKNDKKVLRAGILKGLPRFTNQLLLMMNAGMILSDAFNRICSSYEIIPSEERSEFENSLIETRRMNEGRKLSTAKLITEFAARYGVKELMRIATILTENERRGSDVVENLSRESQYLWENRIIIAKERGKMIDTKMAYPLGMLLILLIVITMAPAMLAM